VTPRISDLLLHAGYRSVRDLASEEDVDRLAIRTGLGSKRAQQIREGVLYYLEHDSGRVADGQKAAHARHEAARQSEAAEREAKTLANDSALTAESSETQPRN
jgi:N utilization substance protein A